MIETPTANETLSIPLGDLGEAQVRIGFGGGELTIGRAEPGILLAGTFEGGVVHRSKEEGSLELEPLHPGRAWMAGCALRWDVRLTTEIPVDLRLDTGANKSTVDLSELRLRRLVVHTGASETNVRLPATGQTSVDITCGFASVNVEVPTAVAAFISGKMALGATVVDETRFPRVNGGWVSPNYETATDRVEIKVEGGFGQVKIA